IADLNRLPAAIFLIDVKKEHIAVAEALKLNIPTFAMVDTNSDPSNIDFPIPANDDATKSISLITDIIVKAIEEGLDERKREKDDEAEKEAVAAKAAADAPEAPAKKAKKETAEAETSSEDNTEA
ncbi:MAG: 30S ribosomal protein S2, partial [Pedobacter sp.]